MTPDAVADRLCGWARAAAVAAGGRAGSPGLNAKLARADYDYGPEAVAEWADAEHARIVGLLTHLLTAPVSCDPNLRVGDEARTVPSAVEFEALVAVKNRLVGEEAFCVVAAYRSPAGPGEVRVPELLVRVKAPDGTPVTLAFGYVKPVAVVGISAVTAGDCCG